MDRRTIIVIGGGIAGLAAASRLLANGFRVTLLEAKERLGGRIHTIRRGRLPIELGAEFIHGKHPALMRTLKSAGLTPVKMPDDFRIWQAGRFESLDFWAAIEEVIARVKCSGPDRSFEQFLAAQPLDDFTRQLAATFAEGFNAAPASRLSAHSVRKAQDAAQEMEGDWQGRVDEGYAALIQFFAREIRARGGHILTRAEVKSLCWRPGSVRVTWERGGRAQSLEANAAILTWPLGVWKTGGVDFRPALKEKVAAVRELEFGNVLKPVLQFRRRWWGDAADGILQALDEPFPTWWSDPRGPLLTAWAGGSRFDSVAALSPARLESVCLEILARLFSERVSVLRKRLVKVHSHRWEADPHFRGAYSYIPVNGLDLPKRLAAPVADTLFFAGEATVLDAQMGTVFGALETGLRAADQVISARWRKEIR